jgi:hypothetical protein
MILKYQMHNVPIANNEEELCDPRCPTRTVWEFIGEIENFKVEFEGQEKTFIIKQTCGTVTHLSGIKSNQKAYLLNDEGKTIERIN